MTNTTMLNIRQNVRRGMLAALACFCMLAPRLAAAAQEVVHVQFDNATGIVDLHLLRDGNRIVSAFAFETGRNTPWLAKSYCTWQLDYADAKDKDLKLAMEIARWCEERHVNWDRKLDPYRPLESRPSCWGWTRAAGSGIRTAGSLVYVWTRLWQETKDPLWKAKADALAQGILVSQDPVDGGLSIEFRRDTVGVACSSHNVYDVVDTAYRLMDYSRLTAAQP